MAVADLTLEGLVHDLNNVFQTIAESAELLEDDPKWEKLAHTLQRSAGRGHRIAHSILETNRSPIELAPIIENASQFCQDYLECANGPKIDVCSEIDAEFRLKGDAAGWERVFVNLFLNSAQAGAKNIRIRAHGHRNCGERRRPRHFARAAAPNLSAARLHQIDHFGIGALRGAIDRGAEWRLCYRRQRPERRRDLHPVHLSRDLGSRDREPYSRAEGVGALGLT